MKTNHTTGEWVVNPLSLNETAFEILSSRPMENGMNGCIAYIKCDNYTKKKQAEANARLIATAPDMLTILQGLIEDDGLSTMLGDGWHRTINNAIQKATI